MVSENKHKKRYKKDHRLPVSPNNFYKNNGWIDWYNFFGKERPEFYLSIKEARQAVQRLGIKTQREYKKRYKEDPRLPSNPYIYFKDKGWQGWDDFR